MNYKWFLKKLRCSVTGNDFLNGVQRWLSKNLLSFELSVYRDFWKCLWLFGIDPFLFWYRFFVPPLNQVLSRSETKTSFPGIHACSYRRDTFAISRSRKRERPEYIRQSLRPVCSGAIERECNVSARIFVSSQQLAIILQTGSSRLDVRFARSI